MLSRRVVFAVVVAAAGLGPAACTGSAPPPAGVGPGHYASVQQAFEAAWAGAPPAAISYMEQIVIPRESGWDPCAINPGIHDCSGWPNGHAEGLLQLLGHDDLIRQVPGCTPFGFTWWQDAYCNSRAGFYLSGGGHNLSPWNGPSF